MHLEKSQGSLNCGEVDEIEHDAPSSTDSDDGALRNGYHEESDNADNESSDNDDELPYNVEAFINPVYDIEDHDDATDHDSHSGEEEPFEGYYYDWNYVDQEGSSSSSEMSDEYQEYQWEIVEPSNEQQDASNNPENANLNSTQQGASCNSENEDLNNVQQGALSNVEISNTNDINPNLFNDDFTECIFIVCDDDCIEPIAISTPSYGTSYSSNICYGPHNSGFETPESPASVNLNSLNYCGLGNSGSSYPLYYGAQGNASCTQTSGHCTSGFVDYETTQSSDDTSGPPVCNTSFSSRHYASGNPGYATLQLLPRYSLLNNPRYPTSHYHFSAAGRCYPGPYSTIFTTTNNRSYPGFYSTNYHCTSNYGYPRPDSTNYSDRDNQGDVVPYSTNYNVPDNRRSSNHHSINYDAPGNRGYTGPRFTYTTAPDNHVYTVPHSINNDAPDSQGYTGPRFTIHNAPDNRGYPGPRSINYYAPDYLGNTGSRFTIHNTPDTRGYLDPHSIDYDDPENRSCTGARSTSYTAPDNRGYPGLHSINYDAPDNRGDPIPDSGNNDTQANQGYTGPRFTIHSAPDNRRYPGPHSINYDASDYRGNTGPRFTIHNDADNYGYSGPHSTDYTAQDNRWYPGARSINYNTPDNPGYTDPRFTIHNTLNNREYAGSNSIDYDASDNQGYTGTHSLNHDAPDNRGSAGTQSTNYIAPDNPGDPVPHSINNDAPVNHGYPGPHSIDYDPPDSRSYTSPRSTNFKATDNREYLGAHSINYNAPDNPGYPASGYDSASDKLASRVTQMQSTNYIAPGAPADGSSYGTPTSFNQSDQFSLGHGTSVPPAYVRPHSYDYGKPYSSNNIAPDSSCGATHYSQYADPYSDYHAPGCLDTQEVSENVASQSPVTEVLSNDEASGCTASYNYGGLSTSSYGAPVTTGYSTAGRFAYAALSSFGYGAPVFTGYGVPGFYGDPRYSSFCYWGYLGNSILNFTVYSGSNSISYGSQNSARYDASGMSRSSTPNTFNSLAQNSPTYADPTNTGHLSLGSSAYWIGYEFNLTTIFDSNGYLIDRDDMEQTVLRFLVSNERYIPVVRLQSEAATESNDGDAELGFSGGQSGRSFSFSSGSQSSSVTNSTLPHGRSRGATHGQYLWL